jgi:hypothetical protein
MASIYDQHRTAFQNVGAYLVMRGEDRVATVALKFGDSVTAYVHWIGTEMKRGRAGGGGYDRRSAACADAVSRMPAELSRETWGGGTPHYSEAERARYAAFRAAMLKDDGYDWARRLEDAGFKVWEAV